MPSRQPLDRILAQATDEETKYNLPTAERLHKHAPRRAQQERFSEGGQDSGENWLLSLQNGPLKLRLRRSSRGALSCALNESFFGFLFFFPFFSF